MNDRWRHWVPCPRLCVGMPTPRVKSQHAHARPWAWHPSRLNELVALDHVEVEGEVAWAHVEVVGAEAAEEPVRVAVIRVPLVAAVEVIGAGLAEEEVA